jgi:hypothetical protein
MQRFLNLLAGWVQVLWPGIIRVTVCLLADISSMVYDHLKKQKLWLFDVRFY